MGNTFQCHHTLLGIGHFETFVLPPMIVLGVPYYRVSSGIKKVLKVLIWPSRN